MLAFLPRWLEVDFVNDLVTILLSVEVDLIQILQNDNPRLSPPSVITQPKGTCPMHCMTRRPLCYRSEIALDSRQNTLRATCTL